MPAPPLTQDQVKDILDLTKISPLRLSKREYFTALAMQGICSQPDCQPTKQIHFNNIAEDAIKIADTVLLKLGHYD